MSDTEKLKEIYRLTPHEEGGSFSEVYTAPFEKDGRPMAGSIYFLLDQREIPGNIRRCRLSGLSGKAGVRAAG